MFFSPDFIWRFERLARAFASLLAGETDHPSFIAPINEISFLAWASGEVGFFEPFAQGRGDTLKVQLVTAAIAGMEAVRAVAPRARVCQLDPVFHVIADPGRPYERTAAEAARQSQYQAWDMLAGRLHPHLGKL